MVMFHEALYRVCVDSAGPVSETPLALSLVGGVTVDLSAAGVAAGDILVDRRWVADSSGSHPRWLLAYQAPAPGGDGVVATASVTVNALPASVVDSGVLAGVVDRVDQLAPDEVTQQVVGSRWVETRWWDGRRDVDVAVGEGEESVQVGVSYRWVRISKAVVLVTVTTSCPWGPAPIDLDDGELIDRMRVVVS